MFGPVVYVALVAWPFLMAALSAFMPVRWVVLVSIIGGNLFLPQAAISFPGIPNYTKPLAAGVGALIPALLLAAPRLLAWRPRLIDMFFFGFLLAPGISSILNGLGSYDALSVTVNRALEWGVAYWVGRALFSDELAIKELAVGMVIGGMVYAPLCLWESVMSPRLHLQLYGFRPSGLGMAKRWGGWRPMVFMQHGLAVAAWMASAAVVAWVLWRARLVRAFWVIPAGIVAVGLVVMTIGLRSTGAAVLVVGMIGAAELVHLTRLRVVLMAVLLAPTLYIGFRVAGWDGRQLVEWTSVFGEVRAGSLNMRLENDTRIAERAMQRPIFGWGGWGRWRVEDEFGKDITISDSWWSILVGSTGVFGLVAAYGTFVAPMFLLIRRKMPGRIFAGADGAAWAVGLAVLLFVIDTLANAMPNTSFMLAAGAMTAYVVRTDRRASVFRRPVPTGSNARPAASGHPRPIDLR